MYTDLKKPNILFIMTDQHHYDCLGASGHPLLKTPFLDSLAMEGTLFENAYTSAPVCAPARAAIFSGQYPPKSGVVNNWMPFSGNQIMLPEHLARYGYETGSVGKLHFVPHNKRWGFGRKALNDAPYSVYADDDKYSDYISWLREQPGINEDPVIKYDEDELQYPDGDIKRFILGQNHIPEDLHMTSWTARETVRFLKECDRTKPFFQYVSFFGPHQPWAAPGKWRNLYKKEDVALPSQFWETMENSPIFMHSKSEYAKKFKAIFNESDYREILAAYYGNISMIDHYIGTIFAILKETGAWDNTAVIFTADHGEHLGKYGLFFKGDMFDSSVRVPLIIKPAKQTAGGRGHKQPVSTLDIYGTICDIAEIDDWQSKETESSSLWPCFQNNGDKCETSIPRPSQVESQAMHRDVYAIIGEEPDTNLTMLREERYKLIRLGLGLNKAPLYELYDMAQKPLEVQNMYRNGTPLPRQKIMQKKLDAWWSKQKTNYPCRITSYIKGHL